VSTVFSGDELDLIEMLLTEAESEIKIEILHCRNSNYKELLRERQREINNIFEKLKNTVASTTLFQTGKNLAVKDIEGLFDEAEFMVEA
jgi:hypothetical protein